MGHPLAQVTPVAQEGRLRAKTGRNTNTITKIARFYGTKLF
jgi:hypothetical protein